VTARSVGIVALVGALGWIGLVWLGARMFTTTPPTAAFDLELLLRAGRDVAAGRSPYDPAIVAGTAPVAERLFYSYPPVVAQVLSVVAGIPSNVAFVAWTAAAVAGWVVVAAAIARRLAPRIASASVPWLAAAVTPLLFPFAIGLLFGNLDAFFPALYGLILLGFLPGPPSGTRAGAGAGAGVAAGAATAAAALAKLHPGSFGLWLAVRAIDDRRARRVLVAAVAAGLAILAVSIATALPLWRDYLAVVRAGSGADLVDPRNAGPAAQIALLVGGGGSAAEGLARTLQVPVALVALGVTAAVARRLADPLESLAWAAVASLVILPVTWYHYPAALLPFGVAALLRSRGGADGRTVGALIVGAALVSALAIAWLPLLYVAVALLLAGVRASRAPGVAHTPEPTVRVPAPG
jgi:hypothetical protein